MKVEKAIAMILFSLVSTSRAETVDTCVVNTPQGEFIVALGSYGDVWYRSSDCSLGDWVYVFDIPGAYLVDSPGSAIVVTPTEMQLGYFRYYPTEAYFDLQNTFPIPPEVGTIADIDLCDTCHPYYVATITTVSGDTWILKCDFNLDGIWTGPCAALPDEPVNLDVDSWGSVKERYR